MRTTKVTCDACERDLSSTGNQVNHRLALRSETLRAETGDLSTLFVPPEINREHHFCDLSCVCRWLAKEKDE